LQRRGQMAGEKPNTQFQWLSFVVGRIAAARIRIHITAVASMRKTHATNQISELWFENQLQQIEIWKIGLKIPICNQYFENCFKDRLLQTKFLNLALKIAANKPIFTIFVWRSSPANQNFQHSFEDSNLQTKILEFVLKIGFSNQSFKFCFEDRG